MVDPAIALPASRPERAPAIGLRFVTALGFTRSGSNNRLPLPAAAGLAFLSGVGLCGSAITSTSSAVRPRSAGKRRDVIELVKSSAAMQQRDTARGGVTNVTRGLWGLLRNAHRR